LQAGERLAPGDDQRAPPITCAGAWQVPGGCAGWPASPSARPWP